MDYELMIKNILKNKVESILLVTDTNNKVYKVKTVDNEILYVKFYEGSSTHIDNELKIYNLVDNKYLKEIVYISDSLKIAIFKELIGKTVAELSDDELNKFSDKIIYSVCDFFEGISSNKVNGYGLLDEQLNGKHNNFYEFLESRQQETSLVLKEYKELTHLFDTIYNKYRDIIKSDNSIVPIDTNLNNIMVLNDGSVKFCDPGEVISGPILMGYGDFVAHTYKTLLYDKLMKKLKLDDTDEKLLRIYAIFSSLNILAFLKKNGVNELDKVIPFGNKYTFYDLISEHLEYLDIKKDL